MAATHDKAINRMVMILEKLSRDERYSIDEFAEEFGVHKRTIYRDIYERLHSFDIVKDSQNRFKFRDGFSLDKSLLESDEMLLVTLALSQISYINEKFSKKSSAILNKLLKPGFSSPYYIKPEFFEDIDVDSQIVNQLEDAISQYRVASLQYREKSYLVEPYKIASFDGLWYLFAKELKSGKVRTFEINRVDKVNISYETFKTGDIDTMLDNIHTAWFEDGACFTVKIKVKREISEYFLRKKHLSTQIIEKQLKDGSLIISFEVSSDEDIDNLIKAWLPHVEIISPARLRKKMIGELKAYILQLENDSNLFLNTV